MHFNLALLIIYNASLLLILSSINKHEIAKMDILPEYLLVKCFDSGDPSLRDKLLCGYKCEKTNATVYRSSVEKHITEPVGLKLTEQKIQRGCFALMSI